MASDVNMEPGFWEKLSDKLTAFSEGVSKFLMRLFGSSNERYIRQLGFVRAKSADVPTIIPGSILHQVNSLEEQMRALSDDDLRQTTPKLRAKLAGGVHLEDLLPEAFAACREGLLQPLARSAGATLRIRRGPSPAGP